MKYDSITSRQNSKIISAASLSDKKHRTETNLFAFEGIKLLEEAQSSGIALTSIFFTERAKETYALALERAFENGASLYEVSESVYEKLTDEKAPQGLFICAKQKDCVPFHASMLDDEGYLILEDIQNPSNVGAMIRTALCLGAKKILLTAGCADIYNIKTVRAAMGALFRAELFRTDDLVTSIEAIQRQGGMVYAATLSEHAVSINDFTLSKKDCIVFGNEGNGVSAKTVAACDKSILIPMKHGSESLNASAAAAIFIWERQKNE